MNVVEFIDKDGDPLVIRFKLIRGIGRQMGHTVLLTKAGNYPLQGDHAHNLAIWRAAVRPSPAFRKLERSR